MNYYFLREKNDTVIKEVSRIQYAKVFYMYNNINYPLTNFEVDGYKGYIQVH